MPRGGARPGSGPKPKNLDALKLSGGFRPKRHAHLVPVPPPDKLSDFDPPAAAADDSSAQPAWQPSEKDLKQLHGAGREFIQDMLAAADFDPLEGELLLEAAHAADALAVIRRQPLAGQPIKTIMGLQRLEQGWQRQFTGLVSQLRLRVSK